MESFVPPNLTRTLDFWQRKINSLPLRLFLEKREEQLYNTMCSFGDSGSSRKETLCVACLGWVENTLECFCVHRKPSRLAAAWLCESWLGCKAECRLVHRACLTSVPSTLPRPLPKCESSDCYLGYRIPFLVCFLLPLSSHFFECPFMGRLDLLPKKCNYQKSTSLTRFCPKQLLPTGEFHIVLRKSATNTNNNKICLYFLDDFFHWGLPGESQTLSRVSVDMSWK